MREAGMITMRLSGESSDIFEVYQGLRDRLPTGPRGGSLYTCSIKENVDGVTSRLYVNLPRAEFGDLMAGRHVTPPSVNPSTVREKTLALPPTTEAVYDADIINESTPRLPSYRCRIGYRGTDR